MNDQLQQFARRNLKEGLAQLPHGWQDTFRLMYARDNGRRSVVDALAMPIDEVVDLVPEDKLDWAMQQLDNSLKLFKEGKQ